MRVLIIGGGGFLGQRLAQALCRRGSLRGNEIAGLTLADLNRPPAPDAPFPIRTLCCDIREPEAVKEALQEPVDVIFHLAAVVSSHAEADFETGMDVNLHGLLNTLETLRRAQRAPVFVFTSSIAVFGGEVPDPIEDWTRPNPQGSYGAQKAIGEQLVADYSRRGMIQGRALRLPTISVRPGRPNRAASSFMSSIIREPLQGKEAVCPVSPDFRHYYLSPRRCIENLILGAELEQAALGQDVTMTMPGRTLSVRDMIGALDRVAGPEPAKLIRWEDDEDVRRLVSTWRFDFNPRKALQLGMRADGSFDENIRHFLEDEG